MSKTKVVVGACMFWYVCLTIGCCGEHVQNQSRKVFEIKSKIKAKNKMKYYHHLTFEENVLQWNLR